jgi:hypothetical protein
MACSNLTKIGRKARFSPNNDSGYFKINYIIVDRDPNHI